MRRISLVGPLAVLAVLAASAPDACACSCIPNDFYSALAGSQAVFLGEVLGISSPTPERPYPVAVTVRVENAWKGDLAPSTIQVLTASSEAACGFTFRVGARYLIYANRSASASAPDALWASLCSRTHETSAEDPDLDLLSAPLPPLVFTVSPNPSVWSVRLAWTTFGDPGQGAHTRLEVLDLQGRRIRMLVDSPAAAGAHRAFWDGRDERGLRVRSGIYRVRLTYGDRIESRQLVMITPRQ